MGQINWQSKRAEIAVSLIMILLVALSFGGNVDKMGQEYTETGFNRALVTFASARAINGLISAAQGTEIAIQPGGLGAVFAPGEILDPINDLVEQFSDVMLFSAAVLGTQKLLIEMSGWVWFSVVLASVLLFWLVTLWPPRSFTYRTRRFALATLGILLIVRFLVPLAAMANEAVFELFLAPSYEVANRQLENATQEIDSKQKGIGPSEAQTDNDSSMLEALQDFYESTKNKADVSAKIDELKSAANETAEDIIDLIALFMVQTLVLPILFAWLGYAAARSLVRYAIGTPQKKESGPPQ